MARGEGRAARAWGLPHRVLIPYLYPLSVLVAGVGTVERKERGLDLPRVGHSQQGDRARAGAALKLLREVFYGIKDLNLKDGKD